MYSNSLIIGPGYLQMDQDSKQQDDYFSWEASYSKAWAVILDDESDSIENSINKFNLLQHKRQSRNFSMIPGLKKKLIRNFVIVIDASKVGNDCDLYPTRIKWILNRLVKFSKDFFEQNPLCQLGFVITRDGMAEKLCDLTSKFKFNLILNLYYF
jgi:transcription initiation factor TFIIH subunit 2